LQPVPRQLAVTSAVPLTTYPPVEAWQPPAALQVAEEFALTLAAPTAFDFDEVRVAQPALVPLSHVAVIDAVVVANRFSALTSGAVDAVEVVAVICAWHAVVPSQPVEPFPVLVARCPWNPATALALPVSVPVQPTSGQSICELDCALPVNPASSLALLPLPVVWPEPRSVDAVASLTTAQPLAAATQRAPVGALPGTPAVSPVDFAIHPAPAHCAIAFDRDRVAGASLTGLRASLAASVAAFRACLAVFAALVAAFFCAAVAPGRAATRAVSRAAAVASAACPRACSAAVLRSSATMSATTWPEPAEEFVSAWQPL
jgi:hypothetical protein